MAATVQPRPRQPLSGSQTQQQPAKRNWLAEIKTEVAARPPVIVIAGMPGIGKTSMAAHAPSPIFLMDDRERGIETLESKNLVPPTPKLPPVTRWSDVLEILDALATSDHDRKTLCIDTIGGLERLMHEEVCRRDYKGEWGDKGFGSYQKGFESSLADWRQFMNAVDRLRDTKAMTPILLSHVKVAPYKNPEGSDYDRYTPNMHQKTWALTHQWADIVVFANFLTFVQSKDSEKKGKASGGQERWMYTEHHASYDAKNRHGLPSEISMGSNGSEAWSALESAINA